MFLFASDAQPYPAAGETRMWEVNPRPQCPSSHWGFLRVSDLSVFPQAVTKIPGWQPDCFRQVNSKWGKCSDFINNNFKKGWGYSLMVEQLSYICETLGISPPPHTHTFRFTHSLSYSKKTGSWDVIPFSRAEEHGRRTIMTTESSMHPHHHEVSFAFFLFFY